MTFLAWNHPNTLQLSTRMTLPCLRPHRALGSSQLATNGFRNTFSPPLISTGTKSPPEQLQGGPDMPTTPPAPSQETAEHFPQLGTGDNITVMTFLWMHKAPDPANTLAHLSQLLEACSNSQYKLSAKGYKRGIGCLNMIKAHYCYDIAATLAQASDAPQMGSIPAPHAKVDAIPKLIAEGIEQVLDRSWVCWSSWQSNECTDSLDPFLSGEYHLLLWVSWAWLTLTTQMNWILQVVCDALGVVTGPDSNSGLIWSWSLKLGLSGILAGICVVENNALWLGCMVRSV